MFPGENSSSVKWKEWNEASEWRERRSLKQQERVFQGGSDPTSAGPDFEARQASVRVTRSCVLDLKYLPKLSFTQRWGFWRAVGWQDAVLSYDSITGVCRERWDLMEKLGAAERAGRVHLPVQLLFSFALCFLFAVTWAVFLFPGLSTMPWLQESQLTVDWNACSWDPN